MTLWNGIVVYAMAWWVILFMTLPWGVRPPAEPGRGHAASAPEKPRLALKMGVTTLLAAVVTAIFAYVVDSGLIGLRPPRP